MPRPVRISTPLALAALTAGLLACGPRAPDSWHEEAGYRWRALAVPRGTPGFTALAARRTGITFTNTVSDTALLRNQLLSYGGGVALGDVDGDGRVDLYFCRTEGPNALYLNRGGWRFVEAAADRGVAAGDRYSTGAVFADVDGDRDLDLILLALGGPNALFLNDGTGHFTDDSTFPGRRSTAGSTTAALADVDGDGALDLYIANYKAYTANDRLSPEERAFDNVVRQLGPKRFEVKEPFRRDYKLVPLAQDQGVALVQRADANVLYRNDGRGRFTEVPMARSPRFLDEAGRELEEAPGDFTLAARFYDVTGDGAPDLYVVNDFEDPDQFWLNDGRGGFRLAPPLTLRTTSNAGMAVDFADVNRDGLVDFFEADMLSRDARQRRTQLPTHSPLPKVPGVLDDRPQWMRNTLFLNRGDTTFAQLGEYAGVDASGWTWSTLFLDVDLDGYEDLLTANGNHWDMMDGDTQDRVRTQLGTASWREQRVLFPRLAQPNYAFRNRGDLTFEEMSARWRFSAGPDLSHGMATADLDGDGDQDLVINRLGAPALVLRNDSPAPRLAVRLRGAPPNTQGIGATIEVRGGAVPFQSRELTLGGLYLSSAEPLLTFATGTAPEVTLVVRWRDGRRSVLRDVLPGRLYELTPAVPDDSTGAPAISPALPAATRPLWADATAQLGHTHVESAYDDFARQPLLPNSLAQLGPGATWADLDGDEAPELLLGTGRGGRPAAYRFLASRPGAGRFVPLELDLPPAAGDLTTLLPLPDGQGGTVLLLGQSSYEAPTPAAALTLPSVLALPLDARGRPTGPLRPAVPGDTASVGPLALADYDGDGDLDLFGGGRVVPGAYPLAPTSRLFTHDGRGHFTLDTTATASLGHPGLVSAALFSDLDGDGAPELILALEWGPLKAFRNQAGRFTLAFETSFSPFYSRWHGLASGDLDGDGRLDLLTTSWGQNRALQADSASPLLLYAGDFDQNQTLDLLLARAQVPLASFSRLRRAVPALARRLGSFQAYADATPEQVLGPAASTAFRLGATTFQHLVFFNRGDHFEARPLPAEAQLAPAFAPLIADFDGDGAEDVVLSQNFFPTPLGAPRDDAGRALWLRGDGQGGFTPVPAPRSGLRVYGDQRSAAFGDYDQDGRLDLVITQNGAATRLFHNQGATPGLRVRLGGPAGNPRAIGAQLRLVYGDRRGPLREVQAGSSYWAHHDPVPVLGHGAARPTALWVRWPGGRESTTPLGPGVTRVTARPPG